jgi:hypothetical protein
LNSADFETELVVKELVEQKLLVEQEKKGYCLIF